MCQIMTMHGNDSLFNIFTYINASLILYITAAWIYASTCSREFYWSSVWALVIQTVNLSEHLDHCLRRFGFEGPL